jgi:hypothetical protein
MRRWFNMPLRAWQDIAALELEARNKLRPAQTKSAKRRNKGFEKSQEERDPEESDDDDDADGDGQPGKGRPQAKALPIGKAKPEPSPKTTSSSSTPSLVLKQQKLVLTPRSGDGERSTASSGIKRPYVESGCVPDMRREARFSRWLQENQTLDPIHRTTIRIRRWSFFCLLYGIRCSN